MEVVEAPRGDRRRVWPSRPAAESFVELRQHVPELLRKPSQNLDADRLRHAAMKCLGDPARDGRLRVRIAAERDGEADGRLHAVALEEGGDRLRYGALVRDVELVVRTDLA